MTLDVLIEAREALRVAMASLSNNGAMSDYMRVMRAEIKLGYQIDKLTANQAVEVAA